MPRYTPGAQSIAFDVQGDGPATTLVIAGWVSHLDVDETVPEIKSFHERLGAGRRLIRYDKRGLGLSHRPPPSDAASFSLEQHVRDAVAVLDAAGVEEAAIFGWCFGGPVAIALAAAHPSRVSHVVLYGSYARMLAGPDFPIGRDPALLQGLMAVVRAEWGLGSRALAGLFIPEADATRQAWLAAYQRAVTTAAEAAALAEAVCSLDIRPMLARVEVPALVLHRRDDCQIPFALGAHVAEHLPGARMVELGGAHHFPFFGDSDAVIRATESFLAQTTPSAGAELSKRELEVLRHLAEGLPNREIGVRLHISGSTVARHLANIYVKLNVASRSAAAAFAYRNRLI